MCGDRTGSAIGPYGTRSLPLIQAAIFIIIIIRVPYSEAVGNLLFLLGFLLLLLLLLLLLFFSFPPTFS